MLATATTVKVLTQNLNFIIRRDLKANAKLNPFLTDEKPDALSKIHWVAVHMHWSTFRILPSKGPTLQSKGPRDAYLPA